MNDSRGPCLQTHLADKAKTPNVVPAAAWLESAARHHRSATKIINDDPSGALQLAWSAMHDIAKAAAAAEGHRLENETHGKIADFLICVFADQLSDEERGVVRTLQRRRNVSSYDDPRNHQGPAVGASVNLVSRLLHAATDTPLDSEVDDDAG